MEVLRRTGPLVRLRLLRKAERLSPSFLQDPPLQQQPLRHSHSFHEGSAFKAGLGKIQETGALHSEKQTCGLSRVMRELF